MLNLKTLKFRFSFVFLKHFLSKIGIEWAAQGFTESGRSFRVLFSTIPQDLQNMGNFFLSAIWEILTHPTIGGIL